MGFLFASPTPDLLLVKPAAPIYQGAQTEKATSPSQRSGKEAASQAGNFGTISAPLQPHITENSVASSPPAPAKWGTETPTLINLTRRPSPLLRE